MTGTERKVWVFFYGSFINREVLAKSGLVPDEIIVARLPDYDIRIAPLANVVPSPGDSVYGVACRATHTELGRLYGQDWVGTYLPEAVLVETESGDWVAALCYVAPREGRSPPARDYVERILEPARAYGFPPWYLQRLEAWRSSVDS